MESTLRGILVACCSIAHLYFYINIWGEGHFDQILILGGCVCVYVHDYGFVIFNNYGSLSYTLSLNLLSLSLSFTASPSLILSLLILHFLCLSRLLRCAQVLHYSDGAQGA